MSTVGAANTSSIGVVGKVIDATPMISIEYLLQITASRMSDMDTDVKRRLATQKSRGELGTDLGSLLAFTKSLPAGEIGWTDVDFTKPKSDYTAEDWKKFNDCRVNLENLKVGLAAARAKAEAIGDHDTANKLAARERQVDHALGPVEKDQNGKIIAYRGSMKLSKADIDGINADLEGMVKSASSTNELEMIDLQQIMSKRAQLLQMTTNMINSFNESTKGIIGNIR
jgi:hypothetical protein